MTDDIASEFEALLQFLYMAPVGLVQTDIAGAITLINPKSAQLLLPLQRNGQLENLFDAIEMVAPELRNMVSSFKAISGTICDNVQFQISNGNSTKPVVKVLAITLIKLDRQRLMAVVSDVTLSVQREQQLKQSDAWLNAIINGVNDYALIPLNNDGVILNWNPSIEKLLGYGPDDVVNKPYSLFFPQTAVSAERVTDYLREADESGWSLHENWSVQKDGSRFWSSCMIAPTEPYSELTSNVDIAAHQNLIPQPSPERGYALVIRDMSERRAATAEMLQANFNDHLTGIANRRSFFESTEVEIKRWHRSPRPLSLLAIDADYFKKINDTYGHSAGDTVLRHLAHRIVQAVRDIDIVARIGGEEFAVLLLGTDLTLAEEIAERILLSISSQVVRIDGVEIRYTVSIGVSMMTAEMQSATDFLKVADKALYVAKNAGRNQVSIADQMDATK